MVRCRKIVETIVILPHAFFSIKGIKKNQRSVVNHQQQGGVADTMHQEPAAGDEEDHKRRLYVI